MSFPKILEIIPIHDAPETIVRVPGSKSITNRALVLAALTTENAPCVLEGVLQCEDTEVMIESLRRLGFLLEVDSAATCISVRKPEHGQIIPVDTADIFVANSGTTMRFLTPMVALGHGRYRLDGVDRMRNRPIQDQLVALQQLGVPAKSLLGNGCPPVLIEARGLSGGSITLNGSTSSQFLSGLLLVAPFSQGEIRIRVEGSIVSAPYINLTIAILRQFGLQVWQESSTSFTIPPRQRGCVARYVVEPDASSASYFFGAAAITRGIITLSGLSRTCHQGDIMFVNILEQMGCSVTSTDNSITVQGNRLNGIDVDMNCISDTAMTLAAVACFAEGPTTIRNVAHIQHKETQRITAMAQELRRVGVTIEEYGDGLKITPQPMHGALIQTYQDHRIAMSMALIGLQVPGIQILNPACVAKTYPSFFHDLELLRGNENLPSNTT